MARQVKLADNIFFLDYVIFVAEFCLDRKPDFFRLIVEVDLRDAEHMHAIMLALEAESEVASIGRYRDIGRRP